MPATSQEELSLLPLDVIEAAVADPHRSPGSVLPRSAEAAKRCAPAVALRRAEGERAPPRGPGWFDSSWELRRGCEVCEGWPGDASLRGWIESWLYAAASLSAT